MTNWWELAKGTGVLRSAKLVGLGTGTVPRWGAQVNRIESLLGELEVREKLLRATLE